jgi:signal transduction histidine kinase
MAVSSLEGDRDGLARKLDSGIRRSEMEAFMASLGDGLAIASRNLERAAQLVQSFKQVAVDQSSSQRRSFDLAEVVAEVLLTLRPSLKAKPYAIECEVPAGIAMDSYPGVVGRILVNLVNNAVAHGLEGRPSGTVRIRAGAADGVVSLSVADDGRGIPEADRRRIFEPFFTTRGGSGGTGLGLNMAHNAARDALGGSLGFETEVGGGTVFTLRAPLVAPKLQPRSG